MPRPRQPARLFYRPARPARGIAGAWFIRDGGQQFGTGCGRDDLAGAEKALQRHIAAGRAQATAKAGARSPSHILIADVIALYAARVAPKHARPHETSARLQRVLHHFAGRTLAAINAPACEDYAAARRHQAAARRELQDLRAAINYHRNAGLCSEFVAVTMPEASPARERWMTRDEAAKLIWAAWRYRERQNVHPTRRHTRRHVARFILAAIYTGSRAGVLCAAALGPAEGRPWVDLERGVFYRRPAGARVTNKRRPPIALPTRLLAHMRRWHRNGLRSIVSWNGDPVRDIDRAFRATARSVGLADVTPHVCRHTSASWLMLAGPKLRDAADYLGMTEDTLRTVYGHLHPDIFADVRAAFDGGSVRAAFARAKAAVATTNSPPKPVNRSRTDAGVRAKKAH